MPIKEVFYRSPHNYDLDAASDEVATRDWGPSLTVQSMTEDADLNLMLHRMGIGAPMPQNQKLPEYGDYTNITNFADAIAAVRKAEDDFMQYPAHLRARFNNNPQLFLDFCTNPANIEDLRALGLANPQPQQATPNGQPNQHPSTTSTSPPPEPNSPPPAGSA